MCTGEGGLAVGVLMGEARGGGGRRAADTFITDLIMTKEHH